MWHQGRVVQNLCAATRAPITDRVSACGKLVANDSRIVCLRPSTRMAILTKTARIVAIVAVRQGERISSATRRIERSGSVLL